MKIKYFLFGAAALALGACSSDENVAPKTGDAYMQICLQLPSIDATRSTTDDYGTTEQGEEVGKDYENAVQIVSVILTPTGGGGAITASANTGGTLSGDTYTTNPFKVTGLTASTEYAISVVVNDGTTVTDVEGAYKTVTSADLSTTIAKPNSFMMTNAEAAPTKTTGADLTTYTQASPFDAGTVKVERVAARFDFLQQDMDSKGVNVYSLGSYVKVTLTEMALVNVSPTFYIFKRVSADGTNTGWVLGEKETSTNYVVDYNYANKTLANWSSFAASNNYLNKLNGTTAATYTTITSLSTEDNDWDKGGTDNTVAGYKIWTYATENTIQADPKVNQINGLTTGVVFKGELSDDGTSTIISTAATAGKKIYVVANKLIGDWTAVFASTDADVIAARTGLNSTESHTDNTYKKLVEAGFKCFAPTTVSGSKKYFVYYTYWNRHNDNNKPSVMGPMEFAVVRNNVYKLAVDDITGFGSPNDPIIPDPTPGDPTDGPYPDPDGDPDYNPTDPTPTDPPYDPKTPDEDSNMYMKVAVKVLPWTVRKNNITF